MKQYIIVISVALCLVSCSHRSKHWETLAQVESYIEERPDSALNVLQGMDKGELSGKEEKAKHALLLSMAMDLIFILRLKRGLISTTRLFKNCIILVFG